MVTGTGAYQELFQGLLAEGAEANGMQSLIPIVKLSGDSAFTGGSSVVSVNNFPATVDVAIVSGSVSTTPPIVQGISGSVNVGNFPNPQIVSGSILPLEFPVYAQYDHVSMFYTGTTLNSVIFREGGASGTVLSALALVHDGLGNLLTVTKT